MDIDKKPKMEKIAWQMMWLKNAVAIQNISRVVKLILSLICGSNLLFNIKLISNPNYKPVYSNRSCKISLDMIECILGENC